MSRAAIYIRVSTPGQEDDGSSLQTQEERCRQYAAEHGYTVAGVYSDTQTGAQYREREGLTQLRAAVAARLVDVVVCFAIDRLSRNQAHLYILAEELSDHRAQLEFVTEDFEDSSVGRFIRAAKAFAAEVEREKIAERSTRGRMARVQSGKRLPSRNMLYGYRWRDDTRAALDIDPVTGPIVQRLYREAALGTSLRVMSAGLTRDGVPAPQGGTAWSLSTISRILGRRDYTGQAIGWAYKNHGRDYRPDEGIALPEGSVPALVDVATWEIVQERLVKNKAEAARNNREPDATLLRGGIARCGYCGRAMQVKRRPRPVEHGLLDYRCSGRHSPGIECPGPAIPVALLDGKLWAHLKLAMQEPEVYFRGFEQLPDQDPVADDLARVDRLVTEIVSRQANLARAIASIDDATASAPLVTELTALANRRRILDQEREQLEGQQRRWSVAQEQMDELTSWCRAIAGTMDALDYTERRRLLDMLGIGVQVFKPSDSPRFTVDARPFRQSIVFPSSLRTAASGGCCSR